MSYSASDFEQDVRGMLDAAGFSFHEGTPDDGELDGRFWYAWTGPEGKWDVECGDNWPTEAEAEADALRAYLDYLTDPEAEGKPQPIPLLLAALRESWDTLDWIAANTAYGDRHVAAAQDAIARALDETSLPLPEGRGGCQACGSPLPVDLKCSNPECDLCGADQPPPVKKVIVEGEEYDYLTCEWRDGRVCVHGWGTYPESSVLAGQAMKRFIDSFETMEQAQSAYPEATPSHPLMQPQISLNHLPDDGDY